MKRLFLYSSFDTYVRWGRTHESATRRMYDYTQNTWESRMKDYIYWIICESRLSSSMCKSNWTGLWSKNTDPNGSIFKIVSTIFSMHNRCPMMIVLTTGNIVGVHGTYLADPNNNSLILNHFILLNTEKIQRWVQVFVVDRGYRDSKSVLNDLRIWMKMPGLSQKAWNNCQQRRRTTPDSLQK